MATIKYYLDKRATGWDKPAPLKLSIRHRNKAILVPTNVRILPEQWDDETNKVVNHPKAAQLNNLLLRRYLDVECEVLRLQEDGALSAMKLPQLRSAIMNVLYPETQVDETCLFMHRFRRFAGLKTNQRTKEIYTTTISRIMSYDRKCEQLTFEDVDRAWLNSFEAFLAKTAPSVNARAIHLRNIRAVFNDAIDDEITQHYPFRKFKIKREATPKRALSVEELRELFAYPVEEYQRKYLDVFKLIFLLIGINIIDLCNLKAIKNGRVEYQRAKTHRLYSIKVEPEALEIINRIKGVDWLINPLDTYTNHKDYAKKLNDALQSIGEVEIGKQGRKTIKPLHPQLTTYWARHSWATIAASLDIPKETIAAALGHGGNTITDIYIDFDQRKVDEANRMVIDWVLYGKK
ncbi:MAG: site-specific integrase [Alistipes sp.]|nr:site-specific integrase [Alistipes sp.]